MDWVDDEYWVQLPGWWVEKGGHWLFGSYITGWKTAFGYEGLLFCVSDCPLISTAGIEVFTQIHVETAYLPTFPLVAIFDLPTVPISKSTKWQKANHLNLNHPTPLLASKCSPQTTNQKERPLPRVHFSGSMLDWFSDGYFSEVLLPAFFLKKGVSSCGSGHINIQRKVIKLINYCSIRLVLVEQIRFKRLKWWSNWKKSTVAFYRWVLKHQL